MAKAAEIETDNPNVLLLLTAIGSICQALLDLDKDISLALSYTTQNRPRSRAPERKDPPHNHAN